MADICEAPAAPPLVAVPYLICCISATTVRSDEHSKEQKLCHLAPFPAFREENRTASLDSGIVTRDAAGSEGWEKEKRSSTCWHGITQGMVSREAAQWPPVCIDTWGTTWAVSLPSHGGTEGAPERRTTSEAGPKGPHMIAKNRAHQERKATPGKGSGAAAKEFDRKPKDPDREDIDLIDVIDQEIAAKAKGVPPRRPPVEVRGEKPALFDTRELGKPLIPKASEPKEAARPSAAPRRPEAHGAIQLDLGAPGEAEETRDKAGGKKRARRVGEPRDTDTGQLLEEFLAADDMDLPETKGEPEPSADLRLAEALPAAAQDLFSELLDDLESTERAVVQEAAASVTQLSPERPSYDPEPHDMDWVGSGTYYPRAVVKLDKQIAERQEELERKISELKAQREQLKKNFEVLPSVLYASGDDLQKAVVRVLTTFWQLKVSELDATTKPSIKEDILVEDNGRRIVFKIKSTSDSHPSLKYITQLWQDLHYSGLGASAEAGLILSHQVRVDPKHRGLAYTGDEEEHLEDIIFIDTRVLYDLTLAIIDHGIPTQEATKLLLRKGRVKSHLDNGAT